MEKYIFKHCLFPFQEIEIHITGEVYTCCPNWNNSYSIGNIYEDKLENIWNSDRAIKLREKILSNDYSLCNGNCCPIKKLKTVETKFQTNNIPKMKEYPQIVKFAYDKECNIACKICRSQINKNTKEELEILNSQIDKFFLPILKNAKILIINAAGDPFGSRHSRLLIKKAAEKYPDLKFDFHTNGILCNETLLKNLGITPDRIEKVRISIHAASAITYNKTVPNGLFYFNKIINNLKYLKKVREEYNFPVYIHFVVTSDNYKEIPDFIKLAEKVNASPRFWEYRAENCSYKNPKDLFICDKNHKKHKDLVKVMQHKKVKEYKEFFAPILADLIRE